MIPEEKDFLVKDLFARFPYGVICQLSYNDSDVLITEKLGLGGLEHFIAGSMCVKPFLRPMSSMTEGEKNELNNVLKFQYYSDDSCMCESTDWLNAHYIDYRGLIEKGLALEALEGMYKIE